MNTKIMKTFLLSTIALLISSCCSELEEQCTGKCDEEPCKTLIEKSSCEIDCTVTPDPEPTVTPTPIPPVVTPDPTLTKEFGDYFGPTNGGRSTWYFSKYMNQYPGTFKLTIKNCVTYTVTNNGSRFVYGAYVLKASEVPNRKMGLIAAAGCNSKVAYIEYASTNTTPISYSSYHHYNPEAWHGKGLGIVLLPNVSHSSCKLNDKSLTKHGQLDKEREVFTLYNTTGQEFDSSCGKGTVKCGNTYYKIPNVCKSVGM